MDFELTEEQKQVRIQARALAARFDDAYWRRCDKEHEFPWEFYQAFADGGWLGIAGMDTPVDPPAWPTLPLLALVGIAIAVTPAWTSPHLPESAVASTARPSTPIERVAA